MRTDLFVTNYPLAADVELELRMADDIIFIAHPMAHPLDAGRQARELARSAASPVRWRTSFGLIKVAPDDALSDVMRTFRRKQRIALLG